MINIEEYESTEAITTAVNDVFNKAFNKLTSESRVYMPAEWGQHSDGWGGEGVKDPLTLYVINDEESKLLLSCSLKEILQDTIDTCAEDGSFREGLKEISKAMRALADKIDAATSLADKYK